MQEYNNIQKTLIWVVILLAILGLGVVIMKITDFVNFEMELGDRVKTLEENGGQNGYYTNGWYEINPDPVDSRKVFPFPNQ